MVTQSTLPNHHNNNQEYENQILKNHLNELNDYSVKDYSKLRKRKLVAIDEKILEAANISLQRFRQKTGDNTDDNLNLEQWIDSSILLQSQKYITIKELVDLSKQ